MRSRDIFTIFITIMAIGGVLVAYFYIYQTVIIPALQNQSIENRSYK
jgi:hypothetical protein